MISRKYIGDYRVESVLGADGRTRELPVYIGPRFGFCAQGERLCRSRRACTAALGLACAAMLVPLLLVTPVLGRAVVVLPLVVAIGPLLNLCLWRLRIGRWSQPLRREQRDKLEQGFAPWSLLLAVLSALSLLGQTLFLFSGAAAAGDLLVLAATLTLLCAAAFLFSRRSDWQTRELSAEEEK